MTFSQIYDGAEPVRINKWLAQTGVCSRREADALIADGLVLVDGETVTDAGRKVAPGQSVTLKPRAGARLAGQVTVMINKPIGFVSAQPEGDQIPAARLIRGENAHGRIAQVPSSKASLAPLGRLDQDSRGLLLLSEDGVLAKAVIGPASRLDKEYRVTVTGRIDRAVLQKLRHGLELDGRQLKPALVTLEDTQVLKFVLREGRNRQIRRMCELVELEVVDLIRLRIGPLELADLPEGKWRPLSGDERAAMIAAA